MVGDCSTYMDKKHNLPENYLRPISKMNSSMELKNNIEQLYPSKWQQESALSLRVTLPGLEGRLGQHLMPPLSVPCLVSITLSFY